MRDIEDLRRALDEAAADSVPHITADRVRRRARELRARRHTTVGAVVVLAAVALAAPIVSLDRGAGAGDQTGTPVGQPSLPPDDPTPYSTRQVTIVDSLGPVIDTGAWLGVPDLHTTYDVVLYLTGGPDSPGFVIGFRDKGTGVIEQWDTTVVARSAKGFFSGKYPGDATHRFQTGQLVLDADRVLDVGLFAGKASRVTVASDEREAEAQTMTNDDTGWTFFWVVRDATPMPKGTLTITAYDGSRQLACVTGGVHIGHTVQNPRDNSPATP